MKIIMVFSSPSSATSEYRNLWCCCPQKREIDTGQLVIDGNGWKVFVFDGLNEKHCNVMWNISMLEREVMAIKKQYEDSSMAILLHGYETEINILKQRLTLSLNSKIMDVCYSSEKGTFYEEDLKPFSNNASDQNFEILWKVIEEIQSEDSTSYDLIEKVRFLDHKSSNIVKWMRGKIAAARNDISVLSEFNTFIRHFEMLEEYYENIEAGTIKIGDANNKKVKILINEVVLEIREMGENGAIPKTVSNSANDCLNKTRKIHSIFNEMREGING